MVTCRGHTKHTCVNRWVVNTAMDILHKIAGRHFNYYCKGGFSCTCPGCTGLTRIWISETVSRIDKQNHINHESNRVSERNRNRARWRRLLNGCSRDTQSARNRDSRRQKLSTTDSATCGRAVVRFDHAPLHRHPVGVHRTLLALPEGIQIPGRFMGRGRCWRVCMGSRSHGILSVDHA